jgi:antirestriction protein
MENTPKIYVADLAAYNEGKLIGEWLDLSEYDSGEEVMEAISDLLKGWSKEQGVKREEYAIHDVENIPNNLYSEYMGEKTFDKIVNIQNVADEIGIPFDVIVDWMGESGYEDPQDAVDSYQGAYKDEEDFAYEMVEELGITSFTDFERYLYVSDTDRRIISREEEQRFREDAEYDGDLSEEEIEERADEIYNEWYNGLEDPFYFLVEEQGLYSAEDFSNVSFVQVDYEKLAEALGYDYNFVGGEDGMTYVFNRNFKKGGRIKSALARDRKYTSDEPHELRYRFERKSKVLRYKTKNNMEKGGSVSSQVAQDIEDLEAVIESDFVPQHAKDKAKKELERLKASIKTEVKKVERPIKKAVDKAETKVKKEVAKVEKPKKSRGVPKGTSTNTIMADAHKLAKEIRKDGEVYAKAFARAMTQVKSGKKATPPTTKKKTITSKKRAVKPTTTPTKKKTVVSKKRALRPVAQTKLGKQMDAQRQALPPGKRISKDGNVYYEYRENRADKFQPTKKTVTSKKRKLLAKGGEVSKLSITFRDIKSPNVLSKVAKFKDRIDATKFSKFLQEQKGLKFEVEQQDPSFGKYFYLMEKGNGNVVVGDADEIMLYIKNK